MLMKKKLITLVCVFALALGLTACGDKVYSAVEANKISSCETLADYLLDTVMTYGDEETVSNINSVMESANDTLKNLNELPDSDKIEFKEAIGNILITTRNIKTFSQKLNKRFLLFRLMF